MLNFSLQKYNRFQAAGSHFIISLLIFFVLLLIMIKLWYPSQQFLVGGGIQGLKLLIPIDLILGPLLTLIVFNTKKKSLKFDLSLIIIVQLAAMSWGVFQIYQVRCFAMVHYNGTFHTVHQIEINEKSETLEQAPPEPAWYQKTRLYALTPPPTIEEDVQRDVSILLGFFDMADYTQYSPLHSDPPQANKSVKLADIKTLNDSQIGNLRELLASNDKLKLYKGVFRYTGGYVIYNTSTASIEKIIAPKTPLLELIKQ